MAQNGELAFRGDLPQVTGVRLLDDRSGEPALVEDRGKGALVPGAHVLDDLRVEIDYEVPEDLPGVVIGIAIYSAEQELIAGYGSHMSGYQPPSKRGHYTAVLRFPRMCLLHGEYRLVGHVADERGLHVYHSLALDGRFVIKQDSSFLGVALLEHHWSVVRRTGSDALRGDAP